MEYSTCLHCQDLHKRIRINSPTELENALILAAKKVHSGSLKEITAEYLPFALESSLDTQASSYIQPPPMRLAQMVEQKFPCGWRVLGWGDTVELYFQCSHCFAVFRLCAETYHGSGGAWEYVKTSDK